MPGNESQRDRLIRIEEGVKNLAEKFDEHIPKIFEKQQDQEKVLSSHDTQLKIIGAIAGFACLAFLTVLAERIFHMRNG